MLCNSVVCHRAGRITYALCDAPNHCLSLVIALGPTDVLIMFVKVGGLCLGTLIGAYVRENVYC